MLLGELLRVGNETGIGIVLQGAPSHLCVDENGRLNQAVARLADRMLLTGAGWVLRVK